MGSPDEDDMATEGGKLAVAADISEPAESSMSGRDSANLLLDISDDGSDGEGVMGNKDVKRKASMDHSDKHNAKIPRIGSQNPSESAEIPTDNDDQASIASEASNNAESPTEDNEVHDSTDILKDKGHSTVVNLLEKRLRGSRGIKSQENLKYCLRMIDVLKLKYKEALGYKEKSRKGRKGCHPFTKEEFMARLCGRLGEEENIHPWATPSDPTGIPGLVMRAWDEISQCQIKDPRCGFLSGSSDAYLDDFDGRKLAITRHSEWVQRKKTAFISTTSSLEEIFNTRIPHFKRRQEKKKIPDNTKLTLINTRARLAAGLPILRMEEELKYYKVTNTYGNPFDVQYRGNSFYEHEYLMPFSIGPEQIVGTWALRDIEAWIANHGGTYENWFDMVGIQAFQEHERVRLGGIATVCKSGCDCCGQ